MYRIGVDIGGTKVNIGIFSEGGSLLANRKVQIADITDIAQTVSETVKELAEQRHISQKDIASCGIGIPGTVSADGKKVLKAPNIRILSADIADRLEMLLGIPTGLVQDSRAAAWGEYLFGEGRNQKTVVCITLGTGIGCGIVLNGQILSGALGSAGEIGHIPAVSGGRACGCGKRGCVEKYAAGGGLDLTAGEILGKGKTAADLFDAVRAGNPECAKALKEAIAMLGNALVCLVNLLSPDCILISGGLSARREEYVLPVIEYVKSHCYSAGVLPEMKFAGLGENAPLYGAAFIPIEKKHRVQISASVMCADLLHMEESIHEMEKAKIDYLHCDIMDNHFVPNLMLPMEMLNRLRTVTALPFDYHIMAQDPQSIIEKLDIRQGDLVSVHYESTHNLQRVIAAIKEKGALASVALNPATPIEMLSEILPELDVVLLMTVNPGFSGQVMTPGSIDKIARLKKWLGDRNCDKIRIETDGNCSFENSVKMHHAGADILVAGTSSIFKQGLSVAEGTGKLRALLND